MLRLHKPILTQRGAYGPVMALSPAAWYRPGVGVTGTLTASNWADQSGNGRDLAQGTAGNQPINLPHTGTDYAYLPGVVGNYFSTPDSAAASITGDIDIRVDLALNDWTSLAALIGQNNATVSYYTYLNAGSLFFRFTQDGTTQIVAQSSDTVGFSAGARRWVRLTRESASGAVNFYTSVDGSTWTPLGVQQSTTSGSMYNSDQPLEVGSINYGAAFPALGKIYRAQIYNGIAGTLAVDFNPSTFAETSTNGATAVASTGETWTLNSTGVYNPAQIVKSSSIFGGADARWMATAGFTLTGAVTAYIVGRANTWANAHYLLDGVSINTLEIGQFAGATPDIAFRGAVCANNGLAIGAKGIITAVDNDASSLIQINAGSPVTGNHTTAAKGGLTLFNYGGGTAGGNVGTFNVYEIIVFNAAHTAAQRASVQQWLALRHAISL